MTFIFTMGLAGLASAADGDTVDSDVEEEIVVTGTRTARKVGDAPVAVEVIDRDAIETSGAEDVADLLEQQSGIAVERGFLGAGIRLRGMDPEHTLILIDGQRVVGRKDGTYDLSRIPVEAIERVEIVKGASSALYGSEAMGGVVNIITRRAKESAEADLHARGGMPQTIDASGGFGLRSESSNVRLDAGWHGNDPYDLAPATPATSGNAVEQLDLTGRAETQPGPTSTLGLQGGYAVQDGRGIDEAAGGAVLDRRNVTEDARLATVFDLSPTERSHWQTTTGFTMYRDQYALDQQNAGALDVYEETRETQVQLSTQVDQVVGTQVVSVGAEGTLASLVSPRLDAGTGDRQRGAVYLQDEWEVAGSPRFIVVPGIRADLDSWFGGAAAPKLSVRLDPADPLVLRASIGTGWRAPTFRELLLRFDNASAGYTVQGNPDLQPERSLSLLAGLEYTPSKAWAMTVSAHRDQLSDLIQTETVSEGVGGTVFGYINVADARIQGVEVTQAFDPTRGFGVDWGLTLLDAQDLTNGRPLEGRAAVRGTAGVRFHHVDWGTRLTSRVVVVGPRTFYADASGGGDVAGDADPYAIWDVRGEQRIVDGGALFVGAENLLDAGDPDFLPSPPRLVYAGFDASFSSKAKATP